MRLVWILLLIVAAFLAYVLVPWDTTPFAPSSGADSDTAREAPGSGDGRPQTDPTTSVGVLDCPDCGGAGQVRCGRCGGAGRRLLVTRSTCPQCHGKKTITLRFNQRTAPCPGCHGTGSVEQERMGSCPECKGTGRIPCATCEGSGRRRIVPDGVRRYLPGSDD